MKIQIDENIEIIVVNKNSQNSNYTNTNFSNFAIRILISIPIQYEYNTNTATAWRTRGERARNKRAYKRKAVLSMQRHQNETGIHIYMCMYDSSALPGAGYIPAHLRQRQHWTYSYVCHILLFVSKWCTRLGYLRVRLEAWMRNADAHRTLDQSALVQIGWGVQATWAITKKGIRTGGRWSGKATKQWAVVDKAVSSGCPVGELNGGAMRTMRLVCSRSNSRR